MRGRQWATVLMFLPHAALLITVIFILLTRHFWAVRPWLQPLRLTVLSLLPS